MTRFCSGTIAPLYVAWLAVSWLAVTAACIRSTEGVPPLGAGGTITGTVEARSLRTGQPEGIEGIAVRALGTGISATTDPDGFFQLDRLPLGAISISIEQRDEKDRVIAAQLREARVEADGQAISFSGISLADLGSISGEAALRTGPGALPVRTGGTLVVAARTPFKAVTGENAGFRLPGLPESRLDLVAFASGFTPARVTGIRVRPGVEVQARPMLLERMADQRRVPLAGEVSLQDEPDASKVEVELLDEADPRTAAATARTGPDGRFSAEVPPGVYRVRFRRAGYTPVELTGVAALREGLVLGLRPVLLLPAPPTDIDADGIEDARDPDRDNDGCPNDRDDFPDDPFECIDSDADGVPDRLDPDDDNDTLTDFEEDSPGEDRFVTDRLDPDTDGDGFRDAVDVCPTVHDPEQTGRACTAGVDPLPTPVITGFSPPQAGVRAAVTIEGVNFSPQAKPFHTVRFGPGGAIASPVQVTDTLMLVNVPYGAQTGTIAILVGDRVATSPRPFIFLEPPEVVRTVPSEARPGGRVVVLGRGFDQPNLRLTLEGREIAVDPCAPGEGDNAQNLEALCFNVPEDAASGPVRVESDHGPAQRQPRLVVLSGPFVRSVRPNPAVHGQTVLITGGGFDPAGTAGDIRVRFAGSAARVDAVLWDDATLSAIVPRDAQNGPLTVEHPAGDAPSPTDLVVDASGPAVLGASITLVQPGDTVFLSGLNLETTTRVRFAGGVTAIPSSMTSGSVSVVVPNGVDPGPVTVEFARERPVTTSFRLSVLETDDPIRVTDLAPGNTTMGRGWSYVGGEIYVPRSGTPPTVVVIDDATFQVSRTFPLGGIPATSANPWLSLHPRFPYGVIQTNAASYVVDIPSFAPRGVCSDAGVTPQAPAVMHPTLPFSFAPHPLSAANARETGILRVNLEDASCAVLARSAARGRFRAVAVRSGDLLVSTNSELGLINVSPHDAIPDGELIVPLGRLTSSQIEQLFVSLRGHLYGLSAFALNRLIFPADGQPGVPVATNRQRLQSGVLSANGRWLLVAPEVGGPDSLVVDLLRDQVARRQIPDLNGRFLAAHPSLSRFIVGAVSQEAGTWATRFTIRE